MRTPSRAQSDSERRRTVLFAIFICLIVFLSEDATHKEELAKKRLRSQHTVKSPLAVPSAVALETFISRLNVTAPYQDIHLPNVYVGERGAIIEEHARMEGDKDQVWVFSRSLEDFSSADVISEPAKSESSEKTSSEKVKEVKTEDEAAKAEETKEPEEDKSFRWNFERSWRTSLDGVNRVKGVLWASQISLELDGIHLIRQHRVTVFSKHPSQEKDEVILGLATTLPESLRKMNLTDKNHTTNSKGFPLLRGSFGGASGLSFGEAISDENPSSWSKQSPEDLKAFLFPGCEHPVRFDLILHYVDSSTDDNESTKDVSPEKVHMNHNNNRPVYFDGKGICANGKTSFAIPKTKSLQLNMDEAISAASFMSIFSIVETVRVGQVLTYLGPLRSGILSDLGPLSLGTFGWIALTDMYMCELLMNMSGNVGGNGWWITAAILKGIQFLFTHIPLLVLIFFGRSRLNSETNDVIVRGLSTCMSRAQIIWLVSMFIFEFLRQSHPRVFGLVWTSFWLPQIYATASLNMVLPITMKDVVTISLFRLVWPLVALSTHILDTLAAADKYGSHTDTTIYDPVGALIVTGWLFAQLGMVYLQMTFGPQFFIPRIFLPKRFDYLAGRESLKEGEECVVCMQTIAKEEAVVTPCAHTFHEKCLGPWLQVKRTCPTCRSTLPALVL